MENHSDTESMSTQILGDWDCLDDWDSPPTAPPPAPAAVEGTRKESEGGSTSRAGRGRGRVLPPWAHPSYEWGGGKWKEDGRKNRKKTNKKKEKESGSSSSLRLEEDLVNEYSSLPPQIAEWYWCIEYVAKFFHKDLRCLSDLMNMGFPHPSTDDYGTRINELLSLRFLESLFDSPTTNVDDDSVVGPRIEFDFSLSSTHVLSDIRKQIKVSELRPGMPELSKFNLLPFIAHKNMSLPLCALEKLRDVIAMENNRTTSAAAPPPTVDPVYYRDDDDQPEQQAARTGLEQTNKDEVVVINDDEDRVQTSKGDEVIMIDGNDTSAEQQPVDNNCNRTTSAAAPPPTVDPVYCRDDDDQPEQEAARTGLEQTDKDEVVVIDDDEDRVQTRVIVIGGSDTSAEQQPVDNNCNTSRETTFSPSSGARVKCTKDGAWLIGGSDDESDTDLVKNIPPRPESDSCWKCQRQGGGGGGGGDSLLLLTCSRSECGTKVHKECLNGEVQFDEHGNFLCPVCWFDRMATEYHECQELLRCAKRKLVEFLPLLSRASKRLRDDAGRSC